MPVIDFRARPNTSEYMRMYTSPGALKDWEVRFRYERPADESLQTFMANVQHAGVDIAVFAGRQASDRGVTNDYIAECVRAFPGRMVGLAGIDVAAGGEAGAAEIERAVTQLGLSGVSLDAHYVKKPFSDPAFAPLYRKALELDVPVVLTMGPLVGKWGDPRAVDELADQFPELKIVCSHGIWPQVTELLALVYAHDNVYLEPSIYEFLPGGDLFVDYANNVSADRFIYASAFPFRPLADIDRFRQFPFKPGVFDKIVWHNAARLLKLE
jgi:predicted TIM-barrel fold metal-dependent hydrolase